MSVCNSQTQANFSKLYIIVYIVYKYIVYMYMYVLYQDTIVSLIMKSHDGLIDCIHACQLQKWCTCM